MKRVNEDSCVEYLSVPNDVWGLILQWLDKLDGNFWFLLNLATLSRNFYFVVNSHVLPSITSLETDVLHKLPDITPFKNVREIFYHGTGYKKNGCHWITGLTSLQNLQALSISQPHLLTTHILSQLTQLTDINIHSWINGDSLVKLTKLKRIGLHDTPISRMEDLLILTQLESIVLNYDENTCPSLIHIQKFPNLKSLHINSFISRESMQFTALNKCTQLTNLEISYEGNYVIDDGIRDLINLESLSLLCCAMKENIINRMVNLTYIHFYCITFSNSNYNKSLKSLTKLREYRSIASDYFVDLSPTLEILELDNSYWSYEYISHLTNLKEMSLDCLSGMTNDIKNLTSLTKLSITSSEDITEEAIRPLTNLTFLGIHHVPYFTQEIFDSLNLPNLIIRSFS